MPLTPAILSLQRRTVFPGRGYSGVHNLDPVLAYVESGAIAYEVESGESAITRHPAAGATPEPVALTTPGAEVTLTAGEAFVQQGDTVSGLRNAGQTPATLLVLSMFWAGPGAASTPDGTPT